jgi:hypothetical protein
MAMLNHKFQRNMRNMKKKTELPDMEDPDTFCNPIEWLDAAEDGMKMWVEEDWIKDGEGGKNRWIDKK